VATYYGATVGNLLQMEPAETEAESLA